MKNKNIRENHGNQTWKSLPQLGVCGCNSLLRLVWILSLESFSKSSSSNRPSSIPSAKLRSTALQGFFMSSHEKLPSISSLSSPFSSSQLNSTLFSIQSSVFSACFSRMSLSKLPATPLNLQPNSEKETTLLTAAKNGYHPHSQKENPPPKMSLALSWKTSPEPVSSSQYL